MSGNPPMKKKEILILVTPVLLFLIALLAFSLAGTGRAAFNRNRRLWQSKQIENYRFTVAILCFCPGVRPATVEVRGGRVASVDYGEAGLANDSMYVQRYLDVATIDALLAKIDREWERADAVTVEYDRTYGYPTRVVIDYDRHWNDDEVGYEISGWMELK